MGIWHYLSLADRRRSLPPAESAEDVGAGLCPQRRAHLNTLLYTLSLGAYLAFGAVVFAVLERDKEADSRMRLRTFLTTFLNNHTCVHGDNLEELITRVAAATSKGLSPLHNVTAEPVWTFGQSFFFAGTLVSTVGYGHMSPATAEGKLFTIIYCVFGIPLTLFLLSAFVDRLKLPSLWLLRRMRGWLEGRWETSSVQMVHLCLLSAFLLVFLFLLPALLFNALEPGWSYLDAFYYCFISLTTIGLGDYIPGDKPDQDYRGLYKIFTTGYLLIGLCGMMLFLGTLYDIPALNLGRFLTIEDESNDPERLRLANKVGPLYTSELNKSSKSSADDKSSVASSPID